MRMLHDPAVRESIRSRLALLQSTSQGRWGKMTVDQMLWHCNCSFENALGRYEVAKVRIPLPKAVVRFVVLNMPWRKGNTPTAPEFLAKGAYDFDAERARTLRLVDEFTAKPVEGEWRDSAFMGRLSGRDWSRLEAKHLDHHLTQFGV